MKTERTILFDGVCNLCNGTVQFLLRHDKRIRFRFAPLQSDTAERLLGVKPNEQDMHSFIYLRKGEMLERSTAALNVAKDLGGLWYLLYSFILIPVCWRDVIYTWIAKNRYRWFGRKDQCMIPEPGIADRFLE